VITVTALANGQPTFIEHIKRFKGNLTKIFELPIGRFLLERVV